MFLPVTGSRFPFYSFHVKAFPESIGSFIQINAGLAQIMPWDGCSEGESFFLPRTHDLNFASGRQTHSKVPSNTVQSSKFLLKAAMCKALSWNSQFSGANRQVQAGAQTCHRELCIL